MKDLVAQEVIGNRRINIFYDPYPTNPRTDMDGNLCTMVCSHRRYTLGDEQPDDLDEYLRNLVRQYVSLKELMLYAWRNGKKNSGCCKLELVCEKGETANYWQLYYYGYIDYRFARSERGWKRAVHYDRLKDFTEEDIIDNLSNAACIELLEPYMVIQPISIYDHSGVTIWFGSPSDRWDSGCVGFGYQTKEDTLENQTATEANWREVAERNMDAEMEVYRYYVEGTVLAYEVEHLIEPTEEDLEIADMTLDEWRDDDDNWESDDSCYGFYMDEKELLDEVYCEHDFYEYKISYFDEQELCYHELSSGRSFFELTKELEADPFHQTKWPRLYVHCYLPESDQPSVIRSRFIIDCTANGSYRHISDTNFPLTYGQTVKTA